MIYLALSSAFRKTEDGKKEYFDILKIGYTEDNHKDRRFDQYRIHNPTFEILLTIPNGTQEQEKKLHYKFRDKKFVEKAEREWFVYDEEIINYLSTATLEEIDKLPNSPDIRSKNFFKTRKELRKILSYIFKTEKEINETIDNLVDLLGDKFSKETVIEYLKSQGKDFSKYYEIQQRIETEDFGLSNKEDNHKAAEFIKHYQSTTVKKERLKMLCELGEVDETGEVINLVTNQLQDSDKLKSYYINLGPKRIKELGYNSTLIEKELGIIVFSPELLEEKIYLEFKEGEKLLLSDVKNKLTDIYNSINYNKSAKTTDLSNWFDVRNFKMRVNIDGTSKVVRAIELLKRLK